MKKTKIAILGIVVLFAVLSVSTASAHVTLNFTPSVVVVPEGECHSTYVEVWATVEDPDTVKTGQFAIHYDPSCVNITEHPVALSSEGWGPCIDYTQTSWNVYEQCYGPGYDMILFTFYAPVPSGMCSSPQMICNFTVHCCNSSIDYCLSTLNIDCGRNVTTGQGGCTQCPIQVLTPLNVNLYPDNTTFKDGLFECGVPPTFATHLEPRWNLISPPLFNVSDMTIANVIDESLSGNYNSLYKYNASSNNFESMSSTDEMENGVGYFINITNSAGADWTYKGAPVTSIDVPMEQGLNMVGWLNSSGRINETTSLAGNSVYVARWDASSQSYEVYEPHAPEPETDMFNDFWTMNRGEGYFVAAKTAFTLSESC